MTEVQGFSSPRIILFETVVLIIFHCALAKLGGLRLFFSTHLLAKLSPKDGDDDKRSDISATVKSDSQDADIKKYTNNAKRVSREEKFHLTSQDVVVTISSTVLFVLYLHVLTDADMNSSSEARLFAQSSTSIAALQLHIAVTLYETALYIYMGKDFLGYAHHIVVIINFSRALSHGTQHFYGAWLGTVEFTNPFLSLTFGSMRFGLMESLLLKVGTIGMISSFFFLRVLSLPLCFYVRTSDTASRYGKIKMDADDRYIDDDRFFWVLGSFSILFLWVLSTWWFSKMVSGVIRRQKARSAATTKESKKNC